MHTLLLRLNKWNISKFHIIENIHMKTSSSNQNIQVFTKIQQTQPTHLSTLLNKQVGYLVHVQTDKVYKIKNCIDSEKSNSQLYKRFSKEFISNVKKSQDQMILCCGLEELSRMETSIGCKKNPGLFLISGIGILDEKYQDDFTKLDIQISFMEYSDGKIYDLLSYTQVPLKMVKKQQNISFGQTYCKIATFSQFLKIFKIALFNNRQRDIKIQSANYLSKNDQKVKSTLIMTIMTKKYSSFTKSNTKVQKNIVIDFAGSYSNSAQQDNGSQKNVWDCFIIQLNNLTCKKKLHYHLVQQNPLLSLTKNILKNGKTFLVSSFSTNPLNFEQNYKYFSQLYDIVDSIPQVQPNQNQILSMNSTIKQKNQLNVQKCLSQTQMLQSITQAIQNLQNQIKNKKYSSLRQYRQLKHKNITVIQSCLQWVQEHRKVITRLFQNKRYSKLLQNKVLADQIKLIGVCVKSDHYKDFYEAKSYLALQRQIAIKTECSRQNISELIKSRYKIKDKFSQLRTKHLELCQTMFSDGNDVFSIKGLTLKILQFLSKIFYNIMFYSQRTLIDQILKQENVNQNLTIVTKKLNYLQNQICEMGKKSNIQFEASEFKKDAHLAILVKQVQGIIQKQQIKTKGKQYKRKTKQDLKQNEQKKIPKTSTSKGKFIKLPALSEKRLTFQIPGSIDLTGFLFNPTQTI